MERSICSQARSLSSFVPSCFPSRAELFLVGHRLVTGHQRGTEPEKHLKRKRNIVPVIAVEAVRYVMKRQLAANTHVDSAAMRKIADIANRVGLDWKHSVVINLLQHQFMSGLFDVLEACVKRVASPLIICFQQNGLGSAVATVAILSPNE